MLLQHLLRPVAATPENPTFNLNDPEAWDAFLAGPPSASGVRINQRMALSLPAVWRAVNILSKDVGKLPCYVYRHQGNGVARDPKHQAYYLLRYRPNEFMSAGTWKQTMVAHALLRGNGYSYIDRSGQGRPRALLILDPETTFPARANGKLWYMTTIAAGDGSVVTRKLQPEDVFHLKGLGADGLQGYDVISFARDSLGLGVATLKYTCVYFRNGSMPNIALEIPGNRDEKIRTQIRESWDRIHSGIENQHRVGLLWGGMKLHQYSINARDAQLIEGKKLLLVDFANLIGVPPHKLGGDSNTSYGSLEQENQSYLDEGLSPWLQTFEEEAREKLLTEEEKAEDSHLVGFDLTQLSRANLESRANYYGKALGNRPWVSINEVRELEGMNPSANPEDDEIQPPANLSKALGSDGGDEDKETGRQGGKETSKPAKPGKSTKPTNDVEQEARAQILAAQRLLLENALRSAIRRIGHAAGRSAKDPGKFLAWIEALPAEQAPALAQALEPILATVGAVDGFAEGFDGAVSLPLTSTIQEGLLLLAGQCQATELPGRVEAYFADKEGLAPGLLAGQIIID